VPGATKSGAALVKTLKIADLTYLFQIIYKKAWLRWNLHFLLSLLADTKVSTDLTDLW